MYNQAFHVLLWQVSELTVLFAGVEGGNLILQVAQPVSDWNYTYHVFSFLCMGRDLLL
jgi:hypothetical protein